MGRRGDWTINRGAYVQVESGLARWDDRSLEAWMRIGTASDRINPISLYAGGGLAYGNDDRRAGFAVAHARLGDPAIRAATLGGEDPERAETAFELTYSHRVNDRLTIQPDIQYVVNPG
jgi:porin